jgi:hypothetical protein
VSDDDLFEDDDPLEHPLWQKAEMMADAPPRPAKGYMTVNLTWLARVLPLVRSADRLVVLMLVYRKCVMKRCTTVSLTNRDLAALGIGRMSKYRALAELEAAGALTVETRNGRSVRVTLHWFP